MAAAGLAAGWYLLPAGCLLRAWCLLTGGCWTCFGERMRNTCRQQNAMTLKDEPSPKYASRRRNIPSEILLAAAAALTAAGAGLAAAAATAAALTAAAAKLALANACETLGFATPKHHLIWFSKRRQNEPPEIPNVPSGTLLQNTKTLVQYCLSCCCCCSVAFLAAVALRLFFSGLVTPKHHLISCPKRCQNEPPEIPNVQHQSTCPCCCCCSATLESFPRTVVVFLVVHNLSSLTRSPLPSAGVGGYYNCMCAVYT